MFDQAAEMYRKVSDYLRLDLQRTKQDYNAARSGSQSMYRRGAAAVDSLVNRLNAEGMPDYLGGMAQNPSAGFQPSPVGNNLNQSLQLAYSNSAGGPNVIRLYQVDI